MRKVLLLSICAFVIVTLVSSAQDSQTDSTKVTVEQKSVNLNRKASSQNLEMGKLLEQVKKDTAQAETKPK